jgi:hypothetical protein
MNENDNCRTNILDARVGVDFREAAAPPDTDPAQKRGARLTRTEIRSRWITPTAVLVTPTTAISPRPLSEAQAYFVIFPEWLRAIRFGSIRLVTLRPRLLLSLFFMAAPNITEWWSSARQLRIR